MSAVRFCLFCIPGLVTLLPALAPADWIRDKPTPTEISGEPWVYDAAQPAPKVIYGTDDRIDLYEETDPVMRTWAASTCALVRSDNVIAELDGSYTIRTSAYRIFGLPPCPGERFGNQPTAAYCTGFLAGPDIIATAGHCYSNADINRVFFIFGFTMLDASTPVTTFSADQVYRGVEVLGFQLQSAFDYSVIRVDRPVTAPGAAPFDIRREGVVPLDTRIGVIGHPAGLPLKLAFGPTTRVLDNTHPGYFIANLDTYGGNSGSPVINPLTGLVEGMLVRGMPDYVVDVNCFRSNVLPDHLGDEDASKTTSFAEFIPGLPGAMGLISFTAEAFACESVASVTVADIDLAGAGSIAVPLGTSAGDSETVTLFETMEPGSFTGGINTVEGTPVPQDGVLQVQHGQFLSAEYLDVDDGSGGSNVVTAMAAVDCVAPSISVINMGAIGSARAVVNILTDEPTAVRVYYGTSCDALDTLQSSTLREQHGILLTGLTPETTYYFSVELEDVAGNLAQADREGQCYAFTSSPPLDYFTQQFQMPPFPLAGHQITFTPFDSPSGYQVCRRGIASLPVARHGSNVLVLADDGSAELNLPGGTYISLHGVSYNRLFVNANGNITFEAPDPSAVESFIIHFNQPRLSPCFMDLNPAAGGTISWKVLGDRLVITYFGVPQFASSSSPPPSPNSNTFQIECFFDGTLRMSYLNMSAQRGIVGLSAGLGVAEDFSMTDFSAVAVCGAEGEGEGEGEGEQEDTDNDGLPDAWEIRFGLDPDDPDGDHGADGDPDEDTLTNLEEYHLGTHPRRADSDFDGVSDAEELAAGTDPTGAQEPHSADTNGNFHLSLSEALRVVQLHNAGAYHCNALSEDGFAPGEGLRNCFYHQSDFDAQDWLIEEFEMLRLIELYASGRYTRDMASVDSFAPRN